MCPAGGDSLSSFPILQLPIVDIRYYPMMQIANHVSLEEPETKIGEFLESVRRKSTHDRKGV